MAKRLHLPISRDQAMLLMLALNELLLGLETFLAHSTSGTILPNEWIPIYFGPIAGMLLFLLGIVAIRRYRPAALLASAIYLSSIAVGLLGIYFHIQRAILPMAPAGERISIPLIVWAPPILGPLTFALVGWIGLSALWIERPAGSGQFQLPGGRQVSLPFGKTHAYFFMVGLGCLATVTSSVLDHARTNFENPWLWLPTTIGVFATVVALTMGAIRSPRRSDVLTYSVAMLLLILLGLSGVGLHILRDLGLDDAIVVERFLRGAPLLAPMLFSDMGALGLVVLLETKDTISPAAPYPGRG